MSTSSLEPVGLYWWRPEGDAFTNFGDELGPLLIERLFGQPVRRAAPRDCSLIAVGSIVHIALYAPRARPIHVWGSGLIKRRVLLRGRATGNGWLQAVRSFVDRDRRGAHPTLLPHAVRGRYTASRLGLGGNIVLGDPGLLVGEVVEVPPKAYAVGVVPHFKDLGTPELRRLLKGLPSARVIDVRHPALDVVREIGACEFVLSSSLHGLVVADGLGVPNRWLRLSSNLFGGRFKYDDYYSVFELAMEPALAPVTSAQIARWADEYSRPGLVEIKRNLMRAYPRELLTSGVSVPDRRA
jgi:hypothetical protein